MESEDHNDRIEQRGREENDASGSAPSSGSDPMATQVTTVERKRRCYDLVSRLTEIDCEVEEQEERLRAAKRRRFDVEHELASERQSFLQQAMASATSSSLGTTSTTSTSALEDGVAPDGADRPSLLLHGELSRRAEREWEEWVLDAKTSHLSRFASRCGRSPQSTVVTVQPTAVVSSTSADGEARVPQTAAADAGASSPLDLPVPEIQVRPATAEPPRLRSRVRTKRSLSLTGPSTPVRKRLEWERAAAGKSGGSLTPARFATTSPTSETPTPAGLCRPPLPKLPTPVRARVSPPSAAPVSTASHALTETISRSALIEELLNPPSDADSSSCSASSANSARVLFEE